MFFIIGSLLGGWILSLFGFQAMLITGMAQIFGVTMTNAGYYTVFALVGMLKSISNVGKTATLELSNNRLTDWMFDKSNKKKGK